MTSTVKVDLSCSSLKAVTLISYLFWKCSEFDLCAEKFIEIIMTVITILTTAITFSVLKGGL